MRMRTTGIVALAIGAAVAVTSAVALTIMWSGPAGMPDRPGFIQGFSDGGDNRGWTCYANGDVSTVAWSFRDRWDGHWEPVNNDFSQFAWASCQNSWAFGYLNGANDQSREVSRPNAF